MWRYHPGFGKTLIAGSAAGVTSAETPGRLARFTLPAAIRAEAPRLLEYALAVMTEVAVKAGYERL